ncbi:MAG TPA: 3-isopropylmalate dehydratase small subunit [Myxococcota bacterium]|nr:3-isopropylmalate dehydratase small subunit [Myxococcota bacterium]
MQPFTHVTGAAAPLLLPNVDTDVIIRMDSLLGGGDLARFALAALRFLPDGAPNPSCVLNEPRFAAAPILLAGPNFGCGSSREVAVTALQALGIRCVIAPSFGDIFHANCFRNGMLPIELPLRAVERLAGEARAGDFTVDLEAKRVLTPSGVAVPFEVDGLQREALLEGLDEIGLTLKYAAEIAAWQSADREARPWVWRVPRTEL